MCSKEIDQRARNTLTILGAMVKMIGRIHTTTWWAQEIYEWHVLMNSTLGLDQLHTWFGFANHVAQIMGFHMLWEADAPMIRENQQLVTDEPVEVEK